MLNLFCHEAAPSLSGSVLGSLGGVLCTPETGSGGREPGPAATPQGRGQPEGGTPREGTPPGRDTPGGDTPGSAAVPPSCRCGGGGGEAEPAVSDSGGASCG